MSKEIIIPVPEDRATARPIDATGLQQVWDTFVKPEQLKDAPHPVEMRMLMGILRAVFAGLEADLTATKTLHGMMQKPNTIGFDYYCACGWSPLKEWNWRFSIHDGRSDDKQREWVAVHVSTANGAQK